MWDKAKSRLTWVIGIVFLVWLVYFIIRVSNPSDLSLVDAKIPEETKDFFRNLARSGSEINIDFIKKLTKRDFDNDKDYGRKTGKEFLILEDENFIIYYHHNDEELDRARLTLRYSSNAIPSLTNLFGTYFYPSLVGGRKLPVYLASSRNDYNQICQGLGFKAENWSAAVTCMIYDDAGKSVCKGIVLGETVYEDSGNALKKTIWHEMTHFVHFTAVDLIQKKVFYNWEYEGLASYFAQEKRGIDRSIINSVKLDGQIANYLDSYWVGYSVYEYIELRYGITAIHQLIKSSYNEKITASVSGVTQNSFSSFESGWRNYYSR